MKKTIIIILISVLWLGLVGGATAYYAIRHTGVRATPTSLQRFTSSEDLIKAFKNGRNSQYGSAEDGMMMKSATPSLASGSAEAVAPEHSTTNVQVEGVDEADVVKNDGNYIYAISGNFQRGFHQGVQERPELSVR